MLAVVSVSHCEQSSLCLRRGVALGYRPSPERSAVALWTHEEKPINTHAEYCIIYFRMSLRKNKEGRMERGSKGSMEM